MNFKPTNFKITIHSFDTLVISNIYTIHFEEIFILTPTRTNSPKNETFHDKTFENTAIPRNLAVNLNFHFGTNEVHK